MSLDPTDLAAQEDARKQAQDQAAFAAKVEDEDYKWLMSSKRGRRIVRRLLDRAGVYVTTFNTNAMQMAFGEGRRNEGLALLAKVMAAAPESYVQMLKETD